MLVTGPTGSGKSTSLAAMIDMINSEREEHILTIEDPIEFLHNHKRCIVNQREIGADADDFSLALKSALREDPDVILVGEMRDIETMSTALTAAETGHLVFATLHTQSTAQTVDRIIDVFPAEQQKQVRMQLSIALQGIVTQQLLPTADGSGRVVACEVLVPTPAVRNLIREGKTHQIYSAIQTSGALGHADDGRPPRDARPLGPDHARGSPSSARRCPRSSSGCSGPATQASNGTPAPAENGDAQQATAAAAGEPELHGLADEQLRIQGRRRRRASPRGARSRPTARPRSPRCSARRA